MVMSDKHLVKGDLPGQLCLFPNHYDRRRINCCPGDRMKIEYELRVDDDGFEYIVEVGKSDLYDEIQSHAMSVDINYLIARYSAGDMNALQRRQAVYGDFTTAPKTFADMLNQVRDAHNVFDQMPVEVKQRFDNSFERWLVSYGSEPWKNAMGLSEQKNASVSSSEKGSDDE